MRNPLKEINEEALLEGLREQKSTVLVASKSSVLVSSRPPNADVLYYLGVILSGISLDTTLLDTSVPILHR